MYNCDTDARHIQAISSIPRRYGRQVKISKTSSEIKTDEADPVFYAKDELNTRAETIGAGSNWILLSASGQCCDVYGFHDNFKGIGEVPIEILATGIRDEHVRVRILIVNKALHFGASLEHSLINPNQIRNFGILVSDNPYDSGQDFDIDYDNQFIPFKSEVSTVFFNYFVPTDSEINTCPNMVLTDSEIEWDPHVLEMATNRPYGENYIRVNSMVEGDKRIKVAVEHESNLCLVSISSHLIPDICYERLLEMATKRPYGENYIQVNSMVEGDKRRTWDA